MQTSNEGYRYAQNPENTQVLCARIAQWMWTKEDVQELEARIKDATNSVYWACPKCGCSYAECEC